MTAEKRMGGGWRDSQRGRDWEYRQMDMRGVGGVGAGVARCLERKGGGIGADR